MRVLFVTPSELSSGEALTSLHMAERIERRGGQCRFLASPFTAALIEPRLGGRVTRMTTHAESNRALWEHALRDLRPDAVVFADYPLLFFSNGVTPLADDRWVASLATLDALAITLDHLGYAQRVMRVSFGPPHLSMHTEVTPALPAAMHVLLPCPMHEPGSLAGRRGTPFRYWDVPIGERPHNVTLGPTNVLREDWMDPQDDRERLVVHAAPNWAWRIARRWHLPHYEALSDMFQQWFAHGPAPVRIVSVNNGALLPPSHTPGVRILNSGLMPPDEYQRLLASADLLLTDNTVSVSIGRAVCALLPVALLRNSRRLIEIVDDSEPEPKRVALAMERAQLGSVFPFEAFPIWSAADIDELGLFRNNSITTCFASVELFGGDATRRRIGDLLSNAVVRDELRARQREYVANLASLPDSHDALAMLLEHGGVIGDHVRARIDTSCAP